jgi:uncharacterized repeat protein (TIGR01451 family)
MNRNTERRNKMKRIRISTLTIAAVFAAVFAVCVPQAVMAVGTTANTSVANTVVVNWNAGAVADSTTDTATFLVDRLVTFTVANMTLGGATVGVLPGVAGTVGVNVLAFDVVNSSNTTLDFTITALNTGNPVTSNLLIYWDNDRDGTYDGTEPPIGAGLDDMPADSTWRVFVVADISSGAGTPEVENIDLLAEALDFATATSLLSDSGTAWQAGTLQNVLWDAAGSAGAGTDGANDGSHSDRGYYLVTMPNLTVTKAITGVTDARAFNNTNSKAIPGATVSYRLVVENTGTGDATGVILTDTLSLSVDVGAGAGLADVDNVSASAGSTPVLNDSDPDEIVWSVGTVANGTSENLTYDVLIP